MSKYIYKDIEKRKKYREEWLRKNSNKVKAYHKEYRRNNKERIQLTRKIWIANNPNIITRFHKQSTSLFGRQYELIALSLLEGSIDMNVLSFAGPYDIEWKDMKIEVKVKNKHRYGWNFYFRPTCKATHLLLFCLKDNILFKKYLIPRENRMNIFIGENSKYDMYLF